MMKTIIGIDVGGSTTKIVGFDENKSLIPPMLVKANDPITSAYGAFGKFTSENGLGIDDIKSVMVTGVGSSFLTKPLYGIECTHVAEFDCIGLGGLYISGLDEAIVVSMGTGTAIVHAKKGRSIEYLGGTGVGGGTLTGLAKKLIGVRHTEDIVTLAEHGDLSKVNLLVSDLTKKNISGMNSSLTASNFGNVSDLATKEDLALGLINMVIETVSMLSLFAARDKKLSDIVVTGNLAKMPQAKQMFGNMSALFEKNYILPELSNFATVIGAALIGLSQSNENA